MFVDDHSDLVKMIEPKWSIKSIDVYLPCFFTCNKTEFEESNVLLDLRIPRCYSNRILFAIIPINCSNLACAKVPPKNHAEVEWTYNDEGCWSIHTYDAQYAHRTSYIP